MTAGIDRRPKQVNFRATGPVEKKLKTLSEELGYNTTDTVIFCINMTSLVISDVRGRMQSDADQDLAVKFIRKIYEETA